MYENIFVQVLKESLSKIDRHTLFKTLQESIDQAKESYGNYEFGAVWFRGGEISIDILNSQPIITFNDIPGYPIQKKFWIIDELGEDCLYKSWLEVITEIGHFRKEEILDCTN